MQPGGLTPETVAVRQATPADLDILVPLFDAYRQFQGRPSEPSAARLFLAERMRLDESVVFLAHLPSGEAAGFTQLFPSFSSVAMAPVYILNDLYIAETARRVGVGTCLLAHAEAFARRMGAVRLSLNVATGNAPGRQLYDAAGWSRSDEFIAYHRHL